MLTKVIRYNVSLHSIQHQFNRNRNIIILHGLMGSSKNFRTISKSQPISECVNSYLPDARNHGDSPHTTSHNIEDLADDIYQYIKDNKLLNPSQRLTLMGHSMGGLAMIQFMNRYDTSEVQESIDRVIIVDVPISTIQSQDPSNKTGDMLKTMLEIDLNQPIAKIYEGIDKRALSKDIGGLLKSDILTNGEGHRWRTNLQVLANQGYDNISNYRVEKNYSGRWKKPVELIYGQLSKYFDQGQKREYIKYFPQMKDRNFHQIDKAGHWVHFQNTKMFLQTMSVILARDNASKS